MPVRLFDVIGMGGRPYPIVECRRCRLCYLGAVYPEDTKTGDVRLWAETELKNKGAPVEGKDLFREYNRMREWAFGHYHRTISERIGGGRILDLGCANGYFLSLFPEKKWERWGVDFNPDNHRECLAAGMKNVFLGDFSRFQAPENSFDVISMIEFIEHCSNPLNDLRECRRLLRPGGLIFIVTGNIDSREARARGKAWAYLTAAPEHKYFFSAQTLRKMLERAGFQKIEFVLGDETNEVINIAAYK